jgi:hypothetical protein
MSHTTDANASTSSITRRRAGQWAAIGSGAYIVAWLVGLVIAPSAPSNTASAAKIHAYYLAHGSASMVQSILVHGVAGAALIVLAVTTYKVFGDAWALAAGIAAAVVSFVQVDLAAFATRNVAGTTASTSKHLFQAINYADTVKLVLLAGFVGLLTNAIVAAEAGARRYRIFGWVAAASLILGGMDFIVDNAVLSAVLEVSLILLLIWAGISGAKTRRYALELIPS